MYLIRDDLYRDESGDLYFRMLDVPDSQDNARELIYKKRFGLYDKTRLGDPPKPLRNVIVGGVGSDNAGLSRSLY